MSDHVTMTEVRIMTEVEIQEAAVDTANRARSAWGGTAWARLGDDSRREAIGFQVLSAVILIGKCRTLHARDAAKIYDAALAHANANP